MLGAQPDPKLEPSNYRSPHLQTIVPKPVATRKPLSKYHLLRPYFEDNYSVEGSNHIALEIERCIKQTRNFQKETPIFVNLIRSRIIYLLQYNLFVASIALLYPLSNSFVQLLLRYVALECKVLYKKEFYTRQYENEVQQRIYRLLMSIYYAYFESRLVPSSRIYKECSKSIISLFIKLKTDYGVNNKLIENIIVGLLRRTGDLDKVVALKGTRQPCSSDSYLDNTNLVNVCRDVITNDYGHDDFLCGSSRRNDVQLCNVDDRDSRNSSKTRVVPTISIDDDDVETVYFERECKPSERTIRKFAEKTSPEAKADIVFSLHKPLVENVAVIKNENKQDDIYEKPYTSYKTSVENIVQKSEISDEVVVIDDENHSYTVNENVAQVSNISDSDQAFSSPYLRSAPIRDNNTSNYAQLTKRQSIKVEEIDTTEELDRKCQPKDAIANFQPKCEVVNTYNIDLTVDDDDDDVIEFFRVEEVIPKAEMNDLVKEHPDQSFKDMAVTLNADKPGIVDDVIPVPSFPNHCEIDLTEDEDVNETSPSTSNTKEVNITGEVGIDTNKRDGVGEENNLSGYEGDTYLSQNTRGVTNLPVTTVNVEKSEDISNTTASSNNYKVNAVEDFEDATSVNDKHDNIGGRALKYPSGVPDINHCSTPSFKKQLPYAIDKFVDTSNTIKVSSTGTQIIVPDKTDAIFKEIQLNNVLEEEEEEIYLPQKPNEVTHLCAELEKSSSTTEISPINHQIDTAEGIVERTSIIVNKEDDNIGEGATKQPSSVHKCNEQDISDLEMKNNCDTTLLSTNHEDKDICYLDKSKGVITVDVELKETSNKTRIASNNYQVNTVEDIITENDNIEGSVTKEPSGILESEKQGVVNLGSLTTSSSKNEDDKDMDCVIQELVDIPNTTSVSTADSATDYTDIDEEIGVVPYKKDAVVGEQKATRNVYSNTVEETGIIGYHGDTIGDGPCVEECEQQKISNSGLKDNCSSVSNSKNEDKDMRCSKKLREVIYVIEESVDTSNTTKEEVRAVPNSEDAVVGEKETAGVLEGIEDTNLAQKSNETRNLTLTTLVGESESSPSTGEVSSNNHPVNFVADIVEEARINGNNKYIEAESDLKGCEQQEGIYSGMEKNCSTPSESKNDDKDMHWSKEVSCIIEECVDTSYTTNATLADSQIDIIDTDEEVRAISNKQEAVVGEKETAEVLEGIEDTNFAQKSNETRNVTLTTRLVGEFESSPSTREVSSNNHPDIVEEARIIGNKRYIEAESGLKGCEQQEGIYSGMEKNCSTSSESKNEDKDMHWSKKSKEVSCVIEECMDTSYTTNATFADSQIDITNTDEEVRAAPNKPDAIVGEKEAAGVLEGVEDTNLAQKSNETRNLTLTTRLFGESESSPSTGEVSPNNNPVNSVEDMVEGARINSNNKYSQGCEHQEEINSLMKNNCPTSSESKNEDKDMYWSKNSKELSCIIEECVDTSYATNVTSADSPIYTTDTVPHKQDVVVGEKEAAGVFEGIEDTDSPIKSRLVGESESTPSTGEVPCNNHQAKSVADIVEETSSIGNKHYDIEAETGLPGREQKAIVKNCLITSSSKHGDVMVCLKIAPNENDLEVEGKESSSFLLPRVTDVTNSPMIEQSGGTPNTMDGSCINCQVNAVEGYLEEVRVDINEKDDNFHSTPISSKESRGDTRCVDQTKDISITPDISDIMAEEARDNVNRKDEISPKVLFAVEECKQNETVDYTTTVSTIPDDKNIYSAEFQDEASGILENVRVDLCKKDAHDEEKEAPAILELKYHGVEAEKNVSLIADIREPVKLLNLPENPFNESEVDVAKRVVEELGVGIRKVVVVDASEDEEATSLGSETAYANLSKCFEETTNCSPEIRTATKFVKISNIPESSSVVVHREFVPSVGESDCVTISSPNDDIKIMEEATVEISNVMEIASDDLQIDVGEYIVEVVTSDALTVAEEVDGVKETPTDDDKIMTLSEAASAEAASIERSVIDANEVLSLATIDKKKKAAPPVALVKTVICKELIVKLERLKVLPIKNLDGCRAIQTKLDQFRSAEMGDCEITDHSKINENEDTVGIDDNIVDRGFKNLLNEIKVDEPSPVIEGSLEIVENKSQEPVIATKFEDNAKFEDLANGLNEEDDQLRIFDKRNEVFNVYDDDTVDETFDWCYSSKIEASNCVFKAQHTPTKTFTSECSGEAVFRPFRTMAERKEYYRLNLEFLNENCSDSQKATQRDDRSKSFDGNSIHKLENIEQETLKVVGKSEAVDILLREENGRLEVPKSPVSTVRMDDVVSKTYLPELGRENRIDNTEHDEESVYNENNSVLKLDKVLPKLTDKPRTCSSENQYQSNEKLTETKSKSEIEELPSDRGGSKSSRIASENHSQKSSGKDEDDKLDVSKKRSRIKTNEKSSKSRDSSIISQESSSSDRSHKSRSRSSDKEHQSSSKLASEETVTKSTNSRSDTDMVDVDIGCGTVTSKQLKIVKPENKYMCGEVTNSSCLESGHGVTSERLHVKNRPIDKTESIHDKLRVLCEYNTESKSTSSKTSSGASPESTSSGFVESANVLRRVEALKHGIEMMKRKSHSKKSSRSRSRPSDRRIHSGSELKSEKYHSKSKHDKTFSGKGEYVKHRSENAGRDNQDISLRGHKDKKYPSDKPRDSMREGKEASSKQFVEDDKLKEKHTDSKIESYMMKESKLSPIVDRNPDESLLTLPVEAVSNVNIANDFTVEVSTIVSTTATSRSHLGTTLEISDSIASDVIVKANQKIDTVDLHEPKPEDVMVEMSDRKPDTTCAEREINISTAPSDVKVFEDCSDNSKCPKLVTKQDLVDSLNVVKVGRVDLEREDGESTYKGVMEEKVVSDPNTTHEGTSIPVLATKLVALASSMELCQTDLKTQEVDILSKSHVNEFNVSKNTRDDRETQFPVLVVGKTEEKLQLARPTTTEICKNSVLVKKAVVFMKRKTASDSCIEDGMSVITANQDLPSRETQQETDETRRENATSSEVMEEKGIMPKSCICVGSKLGTSKAADANLDKSRLTVSSGTAIKPVLTTSQLDSSSYVENCDKNPESSRLELDCPKAEEDCSLNTSTEENGTSSDKVDKQNGRKRKMEMKDATTVKRVKSEDECASSKKLETSMESIMNEMKENVSIIQSEDIDVSAMKRKLSKKIYNKTSIPELGVEPLEPGGVPDIVSEPVLEKLVPPADFDIFDAEPDPTKQIEEQPSSCTDLHDVSVGTALDQISFLNTSLDASAIEQSILEKVKFIDGLEPHNVSAYARYPDDAQRSNRDVDVAATPQLTNCGKFRDGTSVASTTARTSTAVSEHATQSSTVNFGDLSNIILSSEDISILSKMIRTLTPVDTTSTTVTKVSDHEQIETSESWAIIDANLSSSFPDISPMKMFIDRNALAISSDNNINGTSLINKNISMLPSPTATNRPPSYGRCTPTTIEPDHGDVNDHNYYADAKGVPPSKTDDNYNISVGTSINPNASPDTAPKIDPSKDSTNSIDNVAAEIDSTKDPIESTDDAQQIDSSLMSGVKPEPGSTQKINIDNEYAIKNLVSLSQSSSDSNHFSPPNSSEVDYLIGLLDTIYMVGNGGNKNSDAKRDLTDKDPAHVLDVEQERPIEKPVGLDKAADTITVSTMKVSEESTVPKANEMVAKSPVVVSSTPVEVLKGEATPKKTKLLILPSGRSPVLAPPKRKPVTTVTVYRQKQSPKLDVKTKKPPADCTGDNLILLPTMPPMDPDKPKPVTMSTSVTPKKTKVVEGKQVSTAKNAGADFILLPSMQPINSDKSKELSSNKSMRKLDTDVEQTADKHGNAHKKLKMSDIANTTTSAKTALQHPPVVLNIFDKIKLEKRAACTRKSPTLADVRNPDNPTAKRTSPNSKIRLPDIRAREKYIAKNPSPPQLVAKESPAKQEKRDNYIIINTDNLLKLKMKPVHRTYQSCRTDNGHNYKRKSPVLGELTTKLRRVEVVNKDNDVTLKQGDVDAGLRLKLAEEVAPRPVHQKRASYGDRYPSGKPATQYRSGLSSNGYKVTYRCQDKRYPDKKANIPDSADSNSTAPKSRLSSEEMSSTSSLYQTHRSTGHNKSPIIKRRPHDDPLPTSRLSYPSSSSKVPRTYYKPSVSRSSHLSEDP